GEVSYAKLYEAVQALADGATACPACGTELAAVAQDPFARARMGLEQLAQLAVLQQQEAGHRTQLSEAVRALCDEMRRVVAAAGVACPAESQAAGLPLLPPTSAGNWLGGGVNGDQRAWQALLRIAQIIEGFDAQARDV
ncbi:ATPase, partial [Pseudomonas aeruginosa]